MLNSVKSFLYFTQTPYNIGIFRGAGLTFHFFAGENIKKGNTPCVEKPQSAPRATSPLLLTLMPTGWQYQQTDTKLLNFEQILQIYIKEFSNLKAIDFDANLFRSLVTSEILDATRYIYEWHCSNIFDHQSVPETT